MNNIFLFPTFVDVLAEANATMFPGMIHKCPYTSLKIFNATVSATEEERKAKKVPDRPFYPNGIYRNRLAFFDDQDDNIGEMTYCYEMYFYLNRVELK